MKPQHKYNAQPTYSAGKRFDSKLEARYYEDLLKRQEQGEVVFFLRQVPIDLPGGITYRVDFVLFLSDGTVSFVDVKGMETQTFKLKKKQVEDLYPFKIEVVRKP